MEEVMYIRCNGNMLGTRVVINPGPSYPYSPETVARLQAELRVGDASGYTTQSLGCSECDILLRVYSAELTDPSQSKPANLVFVDAPADCQPISLDSAQSGRESVGFGVL